MRYIETPTNPAVPIVVAEDEKPDFAPIGNLESLAYGIGSAQGESTGKFFGSGC
ncbi:hypothetical protein [Mangrovactinospora gilvigrisea]|uniref:hypothetical protein n=1 Tax=Mangrovactinospora gilvigrisea TaxID=1428644 RepID=UPI000ACD2604|nr:hypothetical protein [Mangrovactinospora gilvigrisea]